MTHRENIQPILIAAAGGDREIRVEVTTDLTYIHITPAAVCSHCGHEACLFVACDGWTPCARCHRLLIAERPAQTPMPNAAEILRRADELHCQLAVDTLADTVSTVLAKYRRPHIVEARA